MSFVESVANVVAGCGIALATQLLLFPILGMHLALSENVIIAAIFTIVSLVRSFMLRRLFEWLRVRQNETAAQVGGGSATGLGGAQSTMR